MVERKAGFGSHLFCVRNYSSTGARFQIYPWEAVNSSNHNQGNPFLDVSVALKNRLKLVKIVKDKNSHIFKRIFNCPYLIVD